MFRFAIKFFIVSSSHAISNKMVTVICTSKCTMYCMPRHDFFSPKRHVSVIGSSQVLLASSSKQPPAQVVLHGVSNKTNGYVLARWPARGPHGVSVTQEDRDCQRALRNMLIVEECSVTDREAGGPPPPPPVFLFNSFFQRRKCILFGLWYV